MFHGLCFLIQPNEDLIHLVGKYKKEYEDESELYDLFLLEPAVWVEAVDLHTRPEFEQIKVKLLFLANKHWEKIDISPVGFSNLMSEITGEPPYDLNLFDKWWSLTILNESPVHTDDMIQDTSKATFQTLSKTGNASIDAWLDLQISHKPSED